MPVAVAVLVPVPVLTAGGGGPPRAAGKNGPRAARRRTDQAASQGTLIALTPNCCLSCACFAYQTRSIVQLGAEERESLVLPSQYHCTACFAVMHQVTRTGLSSFLKVTPLIPANYYKPLVGQCTLSKHSSSAVPCWRSLSV